MNNKIVETGQQRQKNDNLSHTKNRNDKEKTPASILLTSQLCVQVLDRAGLWENPVTFQITHYLHKQAWPAINSEDPPKKILTKTVCLYFMEVGPIPRANCILFRKGQFQTGFLEVRPSSHTLPQLI